MSDTHIKLSFSERSPGYQLIASLFVVMVLGTVIMVLTVIPGLFIFDFDSTIFVSGNYEALKKDDINFLRYLLISQDICIFIIPGIYLFRKMNKVISIRNVFNTRPLLREAGLVILLLFCLSPLIGLTSQLNSAMHFPDWLSGMENWMTEKENDADNVFNFLAASKTFSAMIFNLLLIAVLPAIGEEIIFRGVFQNIFQRLLRNDHLGILVTATLFSAIHLQFFGFIPRLILGLALGYLYYYSGNLWMPVIAHFVNNALAVPYFLGGEKFGAQPETFQWSQIILLPISIYFGAKIFLYFRNKSKEASLLKTDFLKPGID